jgi:hypothetical protein
MENGHSQVRVPGQPNRILVLPQFASRAAEIDLVEAKVVRYFDSTPGNVFYGHGAYAKGGAVLLSVESGGDLDQAEIHVRDAASLRPIDKFPAYARSPHDVRLSRDGQTLFIMSGNGPLAFGRALEEEQKYQRSGRPPRPPVRSSVNLVEVTSGKLIERHDLLPQTGVGHLATTPDDLILLAAGRKTPEAGEAIDRSRPLTLTMVRPGEPGLKHTTRTSLEADKELRIALYAGGFSITVDSARHRVLFSHPPENALSVFDYSIPELAKVLFPSEQPTGCALAADGRSYVISTSEGSLLELDAETLELHTLHKAPATPYMAHSSILPSLGAKG